ncbi:copper chaperone PCu(A)C [Brachybacterium sp. NBEC-018]|uniref:copper chaperone PCu(A)C n=1 Tax=Brachybacterium sp. NBEC-018 TaxID=2996004 RepID=UPI002174E290|nr:copper chaperone PCu(A)C [Brachybacterium sp. NBEC-018]UVY84654.1 copper chaperone PCu(A)C [Brachybacterium sp. NBEC-018]
MSRTTLPPTLLTSPLSRRAALLGALALPLAACSAGGSDDGGATGSSASDGAVDTVDTAALSLADAWVKSAESGMSAVFGTLTNASSSAVTLVGAASSAAGMVQLHETNADGSGGMSMKEKEGGFAIPAGGELRLEPGGDHIMLMDLTAPLLAGDAVEVTLQFAGGAELPITATVKDFAGAQENYSPSDGGGEMEGMEGMDHGSMASDGGDE